MSLHLQQISSNASPESCGAIINLLITAQQHAMQWWRF
jgi:hypothetical protein